MNLDIGLDARNDVMTNTVKRRMRSPALRSGKSTVSDGLVEFNALSNGYEPVPISSSDVLPTRSTTPRTAPTVVAKLKDPRLGEASASDAPQADRLGRVEKIPRLTLKPVHALVAILVLVAALCTSLTLLVQQSVNYSGRRTVLSEKGEQSLASDAKKCAEQDIRSRGCAAGTTTATEANVPDGRHQPDGSQNDSRRSSDADPQVVDLNTADEGKMQSIKGVGPVMAKRIIDYRTSVGRFNSVDDLLNVKGIGPKMLEKIRSQVKI
jgi:competence protein ComEA